jgi:hypothetical protein
MLPKEAVDEFMKLYHKRYKIKLSYSEAETKANKFYNLMKILILNSDAENTEKENKDVK